LVKDCISWTRGKGSKSVLEVRFRPVSHPLTSIERLS
jgi:hypothetical protein